MDAGHAGLDLSRAGRRVTVIEKADGGLLVRYGGATPAWSEVLSEVSERGVGASDADEGQEAEGGKEAGDEQQDLEARPGPSVQPNPGVSGFEFRGQGLAPEP